ncbi:MULTISPECIES: cob(I)yrinic acid a,c-diamide adenosyltransferase [Prochlorococcus]|uniref:cob(I)yrinic acid a,c-diamide adenosyltransferase n=1 Tax=Prochlorococcus TaxID=1218 RepID=UPI00053392AA|nr:MULTISPECIES: cob(I)yrinic acid a,c-diamide adenosyltransferase [Prochlorococcus]KGG12867.1 Cob(I)alamin adenosyltransferase [Prochlorococcus sp. MIT 0601]
MIKSKGNEEERLKELDKKSQHIGMGGYLEADLKEDAYIKRMKQRKEVQEKRVKERNIQKSLIIIFTGNGKGKTTAALGMAIRTLGHNKKVAIIQFIKGGWEPGEASALKLFGPLLSWDALGEGFTWETQDRNKDKDLVRKAWEKSISYLINSEYKLVILDEINIAIKLGYISVEEVIQGIEKRPPLTHVVLTGRGAHKDLISKADLVTEMKLLHHPFREQGVKAQEGVEF